jgi:hypothetical protein
MAAIHVATRKGLFVFERGGSSWGVARVAFPGESVTMTFFDARDGTLYAGLGTGHWGVKFRRSRDHGATWESVTAPAFPKQPEGEESLTPDGKPWPWRVEQVWSLEADGRSPGALWCGTVAGGLFHSPDRGDTWTLVRSLWDHPARKQWFGGGADLPAIHSVCVHPDDPRDVVVGVSCGGAWRTRDGGETWTVASQGMRADFLPEAQKYDPITQDPHRIAQCKVKPERLWCQHHNGVFVSDDRGTSWREIERVPPSVFGFAVAAHPRDPDTAWFVPAVKDEQRIPVDARVVVTRTRDGARSFSVLREGLPQEHAYDITLRHALDVDGAGSLVAFGSSTGSLWVSDDGGDAWRCLNTHLPPVYSVRIAD